MFEGVFSSKISHRSDCSPAPNLCQEIHKVLVKKQFTHPFSPQIVLVIGIFAVSISSIFIRFAQNEAPSLTIAAYRLFVSGLVLAPFAIIKNRKEISLLKRSEILLAFLSALLLAIHFHTWISSLEYTSVASSVVIVMTSPLWLAILARIFLNERLTQATVIGLAVALLGGIIVAVSDSCFQSGFAFTCPSLENFLSGEAFQGNILALIGAITGAGYFLIGRKLRPTLSLLTYIFLVYGIAGAILVLFALFTGVPLFGFSGITFLWLILIALIPQLLGHSSFNYALGLLPAVYISLPLLGEPVTSSILAYFLLGEIPGWLKIFGGILIIGGILIGSLSSRSVEEPKV